MNTSLSPGHSAGQTQWPTRAGERHFEEQRCAHVTISSSKYSVFPSELLAVWLTAPLELAAGKGNRDLARRLVRAGAQIETALPKASARGHGEIVSDLLESGASIATKDWHGRTPLHVAARRGETEMVQLMLLLKGADIARLTTKYVHRFSRRPSLATCVPHCIALLAAGADVSLRCGPDETPMMNVAAERGHVEIVRAVVEYGVGVHAVDTTHLSPFSRIEQQA